MFFEDRLSTIMYMAEAENEFIFCDTPEEVEAECQRKCVEIRKKAQLKIQQLDKEHERKIKMLKNMGDENYKNLENITNQIKDATKNGDFDLVAKLIRQQVELFKSDSEKILELDIF